MVPTTMVLQLLFHNYGYAQQIPLSAANFNDLGVLRMEEQLQHFLQGESSSWQA